MSRSFTRTCKEKSRSNKKCQLKRLNPIIGAVHSPCPIFRRFKKNKKSFFNKSAKRCITKRTHENKVHVLDLIPVSWLMNFLSNLLQKV